MKTIAVRLTSSVAALALTTVAMLASTGMF